MTVTTDAAKLAHHPDFGTLGVNWWSLSTIGFTPAHRVAAEQKEEVSAERLAEQPATVGH